MDAGRLFTRGQVLPAFLPARSDTVGHISPFSRTCLRHLTFHGSGTPRQKKSGPNERTDQSSPKNTAKESRDTNLTDAQFKTLVIRKLTELVEFGHKLDEKMKALLIETGKYTGNQ